MAPAPPRAPARTAAGPSPGGGPWRASRPPCRGPLPPLPPLWGRRGRGCGRTRSPSPEKIAGDSQEHILGVGTNRKRSGGGGTASEGGEQGVRGGIQGAGSRARVVEFEFCDSPVAERLNKRVSSLTHLLPGCRRGRRRAGAAGSRRLRALLAGIAARRTTPGPPPPPGAPAGRAAPPPPLRAPVTECDKSVTEVSQKRHRSTPGPSTPGPPPGAPAGRAAHPPLGSVTKVSQKCHRSISGWM
eukprot:883245-Prorocentrum_minimum.AAC.1